MIRDEAKIYARDHHTCVYCGYDGRTFDAYMQLSIDHILPKSCGGSDDPANVVTACGSCNTVTARMQYSKGESREEIIQDKRRVVAESRQGWYQHWITNVAPNYLTRPLPAVEPTL